MKYKLLIFLLELIYYINAVTECSCKTQFGIYDAGPYYSLVILLNLIKLIIARCSLILKIS